MLLEQHNENHNIAAVTRGRPNTKQRGAEGSLLKTLRTRLCRRKSRVVSLNFYVNVLDGKMEARHE